MNAKQAQLLRYLLPILAIIVLAVLLTLTLLRLAGIERETGYNVNANMVWVTTQAHVESLMLGEALLQRQHNPITAADVSFRYDMLLSRLSLLVDGPQARALEALGLEQDIVWRINALRELEGVVPVDRGDVQTLQHVPMLLTELNALLSEAARKSMILQWEEAGAQVDQYRNGVLAIFFMTIGIWVSSAFISIRLLLALKKTKDNERIKLRAMELREQLENERKRSELYRSFGSMVSHQFRTPLAIIDASMQRLIRASDRMEPSSVAGHAAKARAATQRLVQLIESILNADRFMEQLDVQMSVHGLADLALDVVADHRVLATERDILFINESQGQSGVECDPVLIYQILGNLLSNALKYSVVGTAVSVRIYPEAGWVCCAIRDYGRGIPDCDMEHIFKRYFRAWGATDVVGTGLGLHIATELASLQGGDITVSSELAEGSTFVLRLPASSKAESATARIAP